MKKIIKFIVFIMIMETVVVCLSGCRINKSRKNKTSKDAEIVLDNGDFTYKKEFGTYQVSSGWVESKSHSSKGKYFYVKEGQDNDKKPNNISINEGTNRYKKSEHEEFKKVIYSQIIRQVSGSDAHIVANGSTSEKGEIVYTFVIDDKNSVSKQYYIVGEKKYVMIFETVWNKDDEKEVDEVAMKMLNSFEWND